MKRMSRDRFTAIAERYGDQIAGLSEELQGKLAKAHLPESTEGLRLETMFARLAIAPASDLPPASDDAIAEERIVAISAGARPVARILNNQATTEFIGPDSKSWTAVIRTAKALIDKAVPAVGRIELNNSDYPWAGTGWLIAPRIVVTNRHVANLFAQIDRTTSQLVFKPGLLSGVVSADIDFLEEENRLDSAEHPITSILWVAPTGEADVAFLQVSQASGLALPQPIELADTVEAGATIAAIGYPARDPSIRDQEMVIQIFGADVYDKKRLSPGKVTSVDGNSLRHDCSTLGGNSGSVLLDLRTGRAIGLHRAGLVDDSANLGVTAPCLSNLLAKARRAAVATIEKPKDRPLENTRSPPATQAEMLGSYRMQLHVPIEIIVNVGSPVQLSIPLQIGQPAPLQDAGQADAGAVETAMRNARAQFGSRPEVLRIRAGYRFKNGWITDERVVVIEIREKQSYGAVLNSGTKPFPREILGVGVDVRTAALPDQLEALDPGLVLERPGRPGGYVEPRGYDDPASEMHLGRVREPMDAIFHVSPEAGFKNLKAFLGRVEQKLTATMYEWEPNHISDAIEAAMKPQGRSLRMVTQKRGVRNAQATEAAVQDMKDRIGRKFKHVWASVRGPQRLIADSYHIKVASRDGQEVWLSSGNWKTANQPEKPELPSALQQYNREWHAVIQNQRLATLFQKYIEFDFREATRVPLEEPERVPVPDVELFVPDAALKIGLERIPSRTYQDELAFENEELDIQPLLTPDRDAQGDRIFMKVASDMLRRATRQILIQNQSFNLTDDNNKEFDDFFSIVKEKQEEIEDVRIILRDARDYRDPSSVEKQQELIERLKEFGLNVSTSALRIQSKCHTKGIVVDTTEVILGSQNLTNGGSLFNRDASLLVRSPKVAAFFERVFEFDWEELAHNDADERIGGLRLARTDEATPPGFQRMRLSQLLAQD